MARAEDWLDPSRAYMNGAFIPGSEGLFQTLAIAAMRFRAGAKARLDLPYGDHPRQRFDLFLPAQPPQGLLVFVHGGYWLESDRKDWSHLAAGAVARGWACAMPSYRLAPEARIGAMVQDVAAAVAAARALVAGPVVVTGHSAGGHLAARMGCADGPKGVVRVVPISPIAELAPLLETGMQTSLRFTAAELAAESPARLALGPGVQAHVWVGGDERPALVWQARVLAEAWGCDWTVDAGRHHFDVVDGLERPDSALIEACLGGFGA